MQNFSIFSDSRKSRNQEFSLLEIISIAILAVLCGADNWVTVHCWAELNQKWLQQFGMCHKGIPSYDTFSRFFRFVDPISFEKCFISWT